MKKSESIILAVLFPLLSLAPSCSFASTSSCQRLAEYYDKSNEEIADILASKNSAGLRDAEEFANKCATEAFTPFTLKGADANENTMKDSIRRISAALTDLKNQKAAEEASQKLKDFNFAIGLGVLYLSNTPDIMTTTIDNGILRTTTEEKYKLGLWLSTNSFFGNLFPGLFKNTRWGMFTAVQLGGNSSNEILNSFAAGFSFASTNKIKDSGTTGTAPLAFQIGYGLTHIQTYADGYSDGMAIPAGTNQPVMKKTIGRGPVLIVSTTF